MPLPYESNPEMVARIAGQFAGVRLSSADVKDLLTQLGVGSTTITQLLNELLGGEHILLATEQGDETSTLAAIQQVSSVVSVGDQSIIDAVNAGVQQILDALGLPQNQPGPAVGLAVNVQGGHPRMGVLISVDDTGAHADYSWTDDKNEAVPAPLDDSGGAFVVTLSVDNAAVATSAQDPNIATRIDILPVLAGDANVVTSVVDSAGNPGVWPAGSPGALAGTPITVPPAPFSVVPGAAGALVVTASA